MHSALNRQNDVIVRCVQPLIASIPSLLLILLSLISLAGGLTPENVLEAAHTPGVVGVDVSSGVEQKGRPGVKDLAVMTSFIHNSRK